MVTMKKQRDYLEQQRLWEAYRFACFAYEEKPSVHNWLNKQAAHAAWAAEFLKDAA